VGQKVLSKPSADSFAVGRRQKNAAYAINGQTDKLSSYRSNNYQHFDIDS
jgi:hypothetical protein